MDLSHFIPDKIKECDRRIQAKDERIAFLETENAMLYLRLAQVQDELSRSQEKQADANEDIDIVYATQNQLVKGLKDVYVHVKETKRDLHHVKEEAILLPRQMQEMLTWAREQMETLHEQMMLRAMDLKGLQVRVHELEGKLADAEQCLGKEKRRRKELHNALVELRGNIRVHCRARPILPFDTNVEQRSSRSKVQMEEVVHVLDDESLAVKSSRPGQAGVNKLFEFERVYHQQDTQQSVFEEVQPLLTSLLDGYNVCIMAYGQTGSGKTYSMLGCQYAELSQGSHTVEPNSSDGLIPRATRELFRLISEKPEIIYTVEASVVEVYNNDIRDLLASGEAKRDIFTGDDGSMEIPSLTQRSVKTASEVIDLVQYGLRHRHEDATFVHAHSSRSHLVVTLTVSAHEDIPIGTPDVSRTGSPLPETWQDDSQYRGSPVSFRHAAAHRSSSYPSLSNIGRASSPAPHRSGTPLAGGSVIKTKLQLVDLAGSECVALSGVTGTALRETSFINRSLSALADVLAALAENRSHVPYRNSRLTHLLQDTIGGDAKLLVLCCVSPTQKYVTETLQCLGFGSRARQIQRGPVKRKTHFTPGTGDQSRVASPRTTPSLRRSRLNTSANVSHLDLHGNSPRTPSGRRLPRARSYHGAERR